MSDLSFDSIDYTPLVDALIGMGTGTPWALDRVVLFGAVWQGTVTSESKIDIAIVLGRYDCRPISEKDSKLARTEFNARIGILWKTNSAQWLRSLHLTISDLRGVERFHNYPVGYWSNVAVQGCVLYANPAMVATKRAAALDAPLHDVARTQYIHQRREWGATSIYLALRTNTDTYINDDCEPDRLDVWLREIVFRSYEGVCGLLQAELLGQENNAVYAISMWDLREMVDSLMVTDPRMGDIVALTPDLPIRFMNVWDHQSSAASSITQEEANKASAAAERIAAVLDVNLEQCSSNPAKTVATKLNDAFIPSRPANVKEWLNQRATEIGGSKAKESTASTCEPAIDVAGLAECLGSQRIRLKQSDAIELINMLSERQQSQILSKLSGKNSPAGNQIEKLLEQNGVKPSDIVVDSQH